jgi:hypothetical protein
VAVAASLLLVMIAIVLTVLLALLVSVALLCRYTSPSSPLVLRWLRAKLPVYGIHPSATGAARAARPRSSSCPPEVLELAQFAKRATAMAAEVVGIGRAGESLELDPDAESWSRDHARAPVRRSWWPAGGSTPAHCWDCVGQAGTNRGTQPRVFAAMRHHHWCSRGCVPLVRFPCASV